MPRIDPGATAWSISGKSKTAAKAWLEEHLPLAAVPEVRLAPSWWPFLPWLGYRIRVEIHLPE